MNVNVCLSEFYRERFSDAKERSHVELLHISVGPSVREVRALHLKQIWAGEQLRKKERNGAVIILTAISSPSPTPLVKPVAVSLLNRLPPSLGVVSSCFVEAHFIPIPVRSRRARREHVQAKRDEKQRRRDEEVHARDLDGRGGRREVREQTGVHGGAYGRSELCEGA